MSKPLSKLRSISFSKKKLSMLTRKYPQPKMKIRNRKMQEPKKPLPRGIFIAEKDSWLR